MEATIGTVPYVWTESLCETFISKMEALAAFGTLYAEGTLEVETVIPSVNARAVSSFPDHDKPVYQSCSPDMR